MFSLQGRTALVTGAGSGIGAAVARAMARAGAAVVVSDLDKDAAASVADTISADATARAEGGRAEPAVLDVRNAAQAAQTVQQAAGLGDGVLNIVINNAGVIAPAMFATMSADQFGLVLGVHVGGTFTVSQAALPFLPEDGTGRIINVTSAAGLTGTIGQVTTARPRPRSSASPSPWPASWPGYRSAAGPGRTRSRPPSSTSPPTPPPTSPARCCRSTTGR
jgi:3-oxoacyl-[acyl-carrier protein] reductase